MTTQIKFTTAEEAVKVIKSGDHIHLLDNNFLHLFDNAIT